MDPISIILFVAIGGVMIGAGVHFIPVGGAPAAMATATGVGTGTAMLAAGAGLTGLIGAATMTGQPWIIVGIGGNQEKYKTPGTEGHGVPCVCFISGLIGAAFGGFGGGLIYYAIYDAVQSASYFSSAAVSIGLAAMLGTGVFFINSVIASYNIGGTIEGMHDPKFKRIGTGALACAIASVVVGIFCVLLTGGI